MNRDNRARAMRAELEALASCLDPLELSVLVHVADRLVDVAPPVTASPAGRLRHAIRQARWILTILEAGAGHVAALHEPTGTSHSPTATK